METDFKPQDVIQFHGPDLYEVRENDGETALLSRIPDGTPVHFKWSTAGSKIVRVGSVLVWDPKHGKEVTEMWAEYMAAPLPEGFEDTGDVRCSKMGEFYLNAVCVWNNLEPEAIYEEQDWTDCTHFRVGEGPVKSTDEPPVARRILRRKS
jgi:hypothetical protein